MAERKWVNTEPGVLALVGTDFRIVYMPKDDLTDYHVMQSDRLKYRARSLYHAKMVAEREQCELEEIGAG